MSRRRSELLRNTSAQDTRDLWVAVNNFKSTGYSKVSELHHPLNDCDAINKFFAFVTLLVTQRIIVRMSCHLFVHVTLNTLHILSNFRSTDSWLRLSAHLLAASQFPTGFTNTAPSNIPQ